MQTSTLWLDFPLLVAAGSKAGTPRLTACALVDEQCVSLHSPARASEKRDEVRCLKLAKLTKFVAF